MIPFKYNDVTHNTCAHDEDGFWCSTKIDSFGIHVGGEGNWGTCGPNCPLPGNLKLCSSYKFEYSHKPLHNHIFL